MIGEKKGEQGTERFVSTETLWICWEKGTSDRGRLPWESTLILHLWSHIVSPRWVWPESLHSPLSVLCYRPGRAEGNVRDWTSHSLAIRRQRLAQGETEWWQRGKLYAVNYGCGTAHQDWPLQLKEWVVGFFVKDENGYFCCTTDKGSRINLT